jgi:acetamidase/formamidase
MTTHFLDDKMPHAFWDNAYPARIHIEPGDTVVFETLEASAGQITPQSSHEAVTNLSFDPIHPLTGPVYVEGAESGDALEVEIVSIKNKGWGWNAVIPGFGLLGEDFKNAYLHHYNLSPQYCEFRADIRIPYEPFCGVMGVAPREPGRLNTIPPRENGGNLEIRHLMPGTKVWFPVLAPGGLFSCGDCHSAQGDGEVNGTGIESPMAVTLKFNLMKGAKIPELRFVTPRGKRLTVADDAGYYVTTAHGPDLFKDAQQAIRYMIDYIANAYDMTPEQAYCLCGAAVDLKISEIVDAPNWIVSAYLPLSLFERPKAARASKTVRVAAKKARVAPNKKGRSRIKQAR